MLVKMIIPLPKEIYSKNKQWNIYQCSITKQTNHPLPTKLETRHPSVMWIKVYVNKGPCSFPRGNNGDMVDTHSGLLFYYGQFSQTFTKHTWVKGFQVYSNELRFF